MIFTWIKLGAVFYTIMCLVNHRSFKGATPWEVLKGAIWGIVFWPFAMTLYLYDMRKR